MANEAGARGYCPPHLRKTVHTRHSLVLGVICSFEYELDATGNRLSVKDKSGKYTPYQYDPMQQLKAENRWSAKTPGARSYQYTYAYDPNGNRIEEWHDGVRTTYTYGDNNEMLTAGGTSFTYDQFGNTLTNGSATYHWDDDSHLTSATGISFLTDTFTYDGDSRRMSASWSGSVIPVRFIYDELSSGYPAVIAEYTLSGSTFAIGAVYTHGLGLISSNRGGTKRYFHYDGLGSTHALTDSTGATTDTYTYSAFGVQESSTGSSVNPYRYVGQWGYYDDGARGSGYGLLSIGRRFLIAGLGGFLSTDAQVSSPRYLYCRNDVINRVDPSGYTSVRTLPIRSFTPPLQSSCKTCACWNKKVLDICADAYTNHKGDPQWMHLCSTLSQWYYNACKGRHDWPDNNEWEPIGGGLLFPVKGTNIVTHHEPPHLGGRSYEYILCYDKANGNFLEQLRCWLIWVYGFYS